MNGKTTFNYTIPVGSGVVSIHWETSNLVESDFDELRWFIDFCYRQYRRRLPVPIFEGPFLPTLSLLTP